MLKIKYLIMRVSCALDARTVVLFKQTSAANLLTCYEGLCSWGQFLQKKQSRRYCPGKTGAVSRSNLSCRRLSWDVNKENKFRLLSLRLIFRKNDIFFLVYKKEEQTNYNAVSKFLDYFLVPRWNIVMWKASQFL